MTTRPDDKQDPIVFISYNQNDRRWAKWLRRKLEWYLIPSESRKEFPRSRFIRPVFRDRDQLNAGDLPDEIKMYLDKSKYLLVICSPKSRDSFWVGKEIEWFLNSHTRDKIIPFIIDGRVHSYDQDTIEKHEQDECYHLKLRHLNYEKPLLGIAVKDDGEKNRQKAFIRVVSYVLGRTFPSLWKRHTRFIRHVIECLLICLTLALFLAYWFMIPVRLEVSIRDEHSSLPAMDSGVLTVNGSEYTISHPDTVIVTTPLPGYNRLRQVHIGFRANRFYRTVEDNPVLGAGITEQYVLQLQRDSTFAIFAGAVYDGGFDDFRAHPIEGATIQIGNLNTLSDSTGHFRIVFPLKDQEVTKPITIIKDGYQTRHRDDESPHTQLSYLLHHQ